MQTVNYELKERYSIFKLPWNETKKIEKKFGFIVSRVTSYLCLFYW